MGPNIENEHYLLSYVFVKSVPHSERFLTELTIVNFRFQFYD